MGGLGGDGAGPLCGEGGGCARLNTMVSGRDWNAGSVACDRSLRSCGGTRGGDASLQLTDPLATCAATTALSRMADRRRLLRCVRTGISTDVGVSYDVAADTTDDDEAAVVDVASRFMARESAEMAAEVNSSWRCCILRAGTRREPDCGWSSTAGGGVGAGAGLGGGECITTRICSPPAGVDCGCGCGCSAGRDRRGINTGWRTAGESMQAVTAQAMEDRMRAAPRHCSAVWAGFARSSQ